MPFKICTFLKSSSAICGLCADAEPASTMLQTVNASKYFAYLIRLAFFRMVICKRGLLYNPCPTRISAKGGQHEKRTTSRGIASDRLADSARPAPRASRSDPVRNGQTDHTQGNHNGIQICQSPSPSVFRSEGRSRQRGDVDRRVGCTAV